MQTSPDAHTNTQVSMSVVQLGPTTLTEWPFMLTSRLTSTTPYSLKVYSTQVLEIWPLTSSVSG